MTAARRVRAILGPTNTGKTHFAIERMLAHRTGVIGLPLRLLAREVYDRIVALRGPSVVALVTGEERIVPDRAQWWVCTVEAMPLGLGADFVAIDEIQLCADPERGHVFTDRLLNARGLHETLFLGAATMRQAIAALVPGVEFMARDRFSALSYTGSRKISRLKPRSAIVGFSVEQVYAIAELIRRQKGGAAVVMGALSPRTRNAQVAMYQNGDVDFLVATDAIGMGLNLDIRHVAFSSVTKFDGRRMRPLHAGELAQIAGRAGRHTEAGTFGVTGEAGPLSEEMVTAIEEHRFAPVQRLQWRNPKLVFGSVAALVSALEALPETPGLARAREADDVQALKAMADLPDVMGKVVMPADVKLLWEVAQIPDFRNISAGEHAGLLARIFGFLHAGGRVPEDWLAGQVRRIDRVEGDIDTLSRRLAFIRTWTYVAQRRGWVAEENHWRAETRAVEDRLSDALHARLTQRFVDRRTSVLMRGLKQRESLVAEVNEKGEVAVEGELVGRLEGFRFRPDKAASQNEAKALRAASQAALAPHFALRADKFYNAPDTEMELTEQGGLMWGTDAVGKLVQGSDVLSPRAEAFVDEEAGAQVAERVQRRLQHFIDRRVAAQFAPLTALRDDATLTGLARGFAFRMVEGLGVLAREDVAEEVRALEQEARGALRRHGVRFGQYTVFLPLLLKPAPTRLRLVLWGLSAGLDEFPAPPPPGLVTVPVDTGAPEGHALRAGYRNAGARAIRIDMLERLADMLRSRNAREGFEATADMLSITGLTLEQFADLMGGLGYRAARGERAKAVAVPATAPADEAAPAEAPVADAAPETPAEDSAVPEGASPPAPAPEPSEPAVDAEPPNGEAPSSEAAAPEPEAASSPVEDAAAPEEELAAEVPAAELEIFYTFTWAPKPRRAARTADAEGGGRRRDASGGQTAEAERGGEARERGPRRQGKPQGPPKGAKHGQSKGGAKPRRNERDEPGPRVHTARPERRETGRIDPDNPFAALQALKDQIGKS